MIKNDFYKAVNGDYLKKVKILPGSDQFSFAMKIQNEIFDKMQKIPPNPQSPFLNTLHSQMREVSTLSEYSLIQGLVERILNIININEVPDVLFDLHSYGCTPLFTVHSGSDFCNPGKELIYLEECDPVMEDTSKKYLKKLWKDFKIDFPFPKTNLENQITKYTQTATEKRDIKLNYNPKNFQDLPEWLSYYFRNLPSQPVRVNLDNPETYRNIQKLLKRKNLKSWKALLLFHWLDHVAPLFSDLYKERALNDLDKPVKSELEHKVRLAARVWWQDAGLQYVRKCVDPTVKDHANFIFCDVKNAMLQMLNQSSLEPSTKSEAIAKIKSLGVHLGWADNDKDLFLQPSDIYNSTCDDYTFEENYLIACNFQYWNVILQSQKTTNRNQWREMGYYMANACYVSEYNALYIPAALFNSPYLDLDNTLNSYPGIGRVMAHEMSHAIDSQGKHVDSTGKLRDWWTQRDNKIYQNNAKKTIRLYSDYYKSEKNKINGLLTLTENISDLIALRVSWCAYLSRWSITFKNEQVPATVQKKFFKQLAHTRMFKTSTKAQSINLKEDPHASPIARTNIPFSQCPAFYRLFNIEQDDGMYRPMKDWPRFFE